MGLKSTSIIPINAQLMEYVESKDACFLKWLLARDFIKEKDMVFEFTIKITSKVLYDDFYQFLQESFLFGTANNLRMRGEKHGYK